MRGYQELAVNIEGLLVPVKKYIRRPGTFHWPKVLTFAASATADLLSLRQLADDIAGSRIGKAGFELNAFGPSSLRIRRDRTIKNPEGYRITISPQSIDITAASDAGAYYAVQTIRDILALDGRRLDCCMIEDWPDFTRRGVYHDCSRGKVPTLKTLKQLAERLAHWKINELQLYIENVFTFKRHPAIGKGYSPLTPEEILALQDHCKLHHIRLVGSLATFGHMEKILALPYYSHLGELPGFNDLPGGTTLCPTDPGSIRLIGELFEEFIPLFEADDFNICGDEPWELGKGRSKRRAECIGIGSLYMEYLKKLYDLCWKHGKRMNAWADIVLQHPESLADVPKDAVMLNWDYESNGERLGRTREISRAGLNVMVCPGTGGWQTHGTRLVNSMANVANFAAQGLRHGAIGLLNTDWGDNGHRNFLGVSLHSFAHGAAHAWNTKMVNDETFTERFAWYLAGSKTGKFARAIKALGSTYLTCGCPNPINGCALFWTLVEPTRYANERIRSRIELTTVHGLKKVVSQLSDESIWPDPTKGMPDFEALTLLEYKVAAQMDCLAAQRALIVKAMRDGQTVSSARLHDIAHRMHDISRKFAGLWMARNKPSRLQDNLSLFRHAEKV
jgi:hypothetical protein